MAPRPQPAHWPLVVMLVLTQLSVGMLIAAPGLAPSFVTHYVTNTGSSPSDGVELVAYYVTFAWLLAGAGLATSVFHLGQPLKAWRCFLGWRRSWLSREIIGLVIYFGMLSVGVGAGQPAPAVVLLAAGTGLAGIFCSAMLYADTRRRAWRLAVSAGKFFGTALITALGLVAPPLAALALGGKLLLEGAALRGEGVTARLQRGPLRRAVMLRFALGGGALLALADGSALPGLVLFAAGELAERCLFFRAVDAPKMPGLPAA